MKTLPLVVLVTLALSLCACSSQDRESPTASTSKPSTSEFAYTTYQGGIYLVGPTHEKHEIVAPNNVIKRNLEWSPDRTTLAYVEVGFTPKLTETLRIVNSDGSNARILFGPANPLLYSWEVDGQSIYVEEAVKYSRIPFDTDSVIKAYLIDTTNGRIQETQQRPREKHDGFWSPDHQKLANTEFNSGNRVCVFFVSTESRKCFDAEWTVNVVAWSPDSRYILYLGKTPSREPDLFAIDLTSEQTINLTRDGNSGLETDFAN